MLQKWLTVVMYVQDLEPENGIDRIVGGQVSFSNEIRIVFLILTELSLTSSLNRPCTSPSDSQHKMELVCRYSVAKIFGG